MLQKQSGRAVLLSCLFAKRSKARRTLRGEEGVTRMRARMACRSHDDRCVCRTMRFTICCMDERCAGVMYGTVTLAGRHIGMFNRDAIRSKSLLRTPRRHPPPPKSKKTSKMPWNSIFEKKCAKRCFSKTLSMGSNFTKKNSNKCFGKHKQ